VRQGIEVVTEYPDALYPDFVKIAEGFGVKGRRVIQKSELKAAIQEMLDHDKLGSDRLTAVGLKYDKDSNEYEKAGGTRTSERKAPVRKAKAATAGR
jgi:thiamine pyrophosphate-dependent acetolactate synthase large subunit-like protein